MCIRKRLGGLILCGALLLAGPVTAKEAQPMAKDPVLEAQLMSISEELRCLVCQNQTIADSDADLAVDLRNQVREMLLEGKTEQEIIDYMVQRYGDFVRYRPPVNNTTMLLWFGPFVLFAAGLALLFMNLRSRKKQLEQAPDEISEKEHQQVQALLKKNMGGTE